MAANDWGTYSNPLDADKYVHAATVPVSCRHSGQDMCSPLGLLALLPLCLCRLPSPTMTQTPWTGATPRPPTPPAQSQAMRLPMDPRAGLMLELLLAGLTGAAPTLTHLLMGFDASQGPGPECEHQGWLSLNLLPALDGPCCYLAELLARCCCRSASEMYMICHAHIDSHCLASFNAYTASTVS